MLYISALVFGPITVLLKLWRVYSPGWISQSVKTTRPNLGLALISPRTSSNLGLVLTLRKIDLWAAVLLKWFFHSQCQPRWECFSKSSAHITKNRCYTLCNEIMTEMSYVSLTLWIIAIDVKGQCEQSPRDSTAPQTDREAVFVYSNAFKNNATTVAGFGHIVNLKGKKTFVHLNWRVLIPFVDRVFGHDMNPYSLWMKMFVIKSTCRSFSIISLYVFEKQKGKSQSNVFRTSKLYSSQACEEGCLLCEPETQGYTKCSGLF